MKLKKLIPYFIIFVFIATVFWVWLPVSGERLGSGDFALILISFGSLAGLLLQVALLFQLILIGRISFVESAFGHDKLNRVHRISGYSLTLFLLAHPLLLIWGYSHYYANFWTTFTNTVFQREWVILAFLAFLILFAIVAISLPWVRRKLRYEVWYASHLMVYVALLLSLLHEFNGTSISYGNNKFYWAGLLLLVAVIYGYHRFIRPMILAFKYRFYIEKVVQETADVFSVYIKGRNIGNFKYKPGQFANYYFLTKGFLFSHPFSFSCAPNNEYIRISVKNLGKYTSRVRDLKPGTRVMIDGPLGAFTTENAKHDKFLFLGGGIGITPLRSMIEDISTRSDAVLIYGARKLADAALISEIKNYPAQTHLVLSDEDVAGYENGKIDIEKIKKIVPDFQEREIYVCGPTGMMDSIIKALRLENIPKNQIHFEKFSY